MRTGTLHALALVLCVGANPVAAKDASLLGSALTYNGAEVGGTADGIIPAFSGGITTPPKGYKKGGDHIDPFAADRPLYSINAKNAAQHENKLSAGQLALLAKYPETYRLDVYPTRRACALPAFVQKATRDNVGRARLINGGNGVAGGHIGVPFPMPENGLQIYWNHNFYWHGHRYHGKTSGAHVYPNGSRTKIVREDWRYNFYADPQGPYASKANAQFDWMGVWSAPVRYSGSGFSLTNTIDQVKEPRNGFVFRPDTRKVLRAPTLAITYDGLLSTANGLRHNDNMFIFSGAPDRYEWRLLGKKRMIVPYNAYKASATSTSHDALMPPNHLNPDYMRFEEHRVWVVEATQKPQFGMAAHRRVFYADEDSWIFLKSDIFDKNDKLTHVQHAFIKNYYEAPACVFEFDVMHDMETGQYNVDHIKLDNGPADLDYDGLNPGDFGSQALRRKVGR